MSDRKKTRENVTDIYKISKIIFKSFESSIQVILLLHSGFTELDNLI